MTSSVSFIATSAAQRGASIERRILRGGQA